MRFVAICSLLKTAPEIANPPRLIVLDPADAVYTALKSVVAIFDNSSAPSFIPAQAAPL